MPLLMHLPPARLPIGLSGVHSALLTTSTHSSVIVPMESCTCMSLQQIPSSGRPAREKTVSDVLLSVAQKFKRMGADSPLKNNVQYD